MKPIPKPTPKQRALAKIVVRNPTWSLAKCAREAGYSEAEYWHCAKELYARPGFQAALADERAEYKGLLRERLPLTVAADRLVALTNSEDEGTSLRALTTALEHMGVVEPKDKQTVILLAIQTIAPMLRPYIDPTKEADLARYLTNLRG